MLNIFAENGVKRDDGSYQLDMAVTPISWCITSELIDKDEPTTLINPHVLIATFDEFATMPLGQHHSIYQRRIYRSASWLIQRYHPD